MELLQQLNEEEKITVALVTHEPDMAEYAKRKFTFVTDAWLPILRRSSHDWQRFITSSETNFPQSSSPNADGVGYCDWRGGRYYDGHGR